MDTSSYSMCHKIVSRKTNTFRRLCKKQKKSREKKCRLFVKQLLLYAPGSQNTSLENNILLYLTLVLDGLILLRL